MTRRYYANSAPRQTLQSGITSGSTSCTINGSFAGWPVQFPFGAILDYGTGSEEAVLVTAIVGTVATITRGFDGYTAVAHSAGATLDQAVLRIDIDEANAHVNSSSGVHGVGGFVVGTTDVQTLTNKTLTSPTVNTPSLSGGTATKTLSVGDATTAAVRAKAGAAAARALETQDSTGATKLTVDGDTGSLSTPGSVGAASVSATGAVSSATLNTSGAATLASATVSGQLEVQGNLKADKYINFASFTNQATATAAGTPVVGSVVYLSAPTNAPAGLFIWNGAWQPFMPDSMPRGPIARLTSSADATATSTTEVALSGIDSQTFSVANIDGTNRSIRLSLKGNLIGVSGGELGRIIIKVDGVGVFQWQQQTSTSGASGQAYDGMSDNVTLAPGSHTLQCTVLKASGGSSVTAQAGCVVLIEDAGIGI